MRLPSGPQIRLVCTYLALAVVILLLQGRLFEDVWLAAVGAAPSFWWHMVTLAAMGATMLRKYSRPLTALGLGMLVLILDSGIGGTLGVWLCLTDLVYFAGLRGDRRAMRSVELGAVLVTVIAVAVPWGGLGLGEAVNVGLLVGAVLLLPLWWAAEVRLGHPLGPLAEEREQLEQERDRLRRREQVLDRQQAVLAERRRMAQDLHDGVAAHVSAVALRSAAALQAAPDQTRDREALTAVRTTSLTALEDLRAMVTLLRDGGEVGLGAGTTSRWGVTRSPADAVIAAADLGLDVRVSGEPLEVLPEETAGPVLHEALMNVLAHGDAEQPVVVEVSADPRTEAGAEVEMKTLTVRSVLRGDADGQAGSSEHAPWGRAAPSFLSTGTGVDSMAERAHRGRGSLTAGPEHGEWVVRCVLPAVRQQAADARITGREQG